MEKAIIVQESLKEIDEMLEEGWTVKSMCSLVESVSVSTACDFKTEKLIGHGRALVILEDGQL